MLALLTAGCSDRGRAAAGTEELVLVAAVSLTGTLSNEGQLVRNGYDLCVERVNMLGGVKVGGRARTLRLDARDDGSDPDRAAAVVGDYVSQGQRLVLGPYGSTNTAAVAPVVERAGAVLVNVAGADDAIFRSGYRRTFAVLSPASTYAASMLQAISRLARPAPHRLALLNADDGFSTTAADSAEVAARAMGMTVATRQTFASGSTGLLPQLRAAADVRPDLVLVSAHLAEGVAVVQQAEAAGLRPPGGFAETVAPPIPAFAQKLGGKAEGVVGSSQWVPQVQGEDRYFGNARRYDAIYLGRFGVHPAYQAAEASAGCLAMVEAVQKAGSTDPDRVRDALSTLDESTFFGRIVFDRLGRNVTKAMSVVQIQDGRPVTVWPPEQSRSKLVWPPTA